eukprot:NODE_3017_length_1293_cov_141.181197_g2863_i0.p1 GENE.NODE_3017_length_1293_cov_141.181197_g2863_i0~~NODE_3017_length_1293_cov_141.181197_g2863_i0.p1  ORF type:complete len:378 (-),score=53.57 NODE_3017_length_1293_cov_141.181197_g2863_i0:51-1184(-)
MGGKYTKLLPLDPPTGAEAEQNQAQLYVGPLDYLLEEGVLEELGIKAVVAALSSEPADMEKCLAGNHISSDDVRMFPLEDSRAEYVSLFQYPNIWAATQFIHDRRTEGKPVLIHCDAGITRAPTITLAYLLRFGISLSQPEPMPLLQAHDLLNKRRKIDVHLFWQELLRMEELIASGHAPTPIADVSWPPHDPQFDASPPVPDFSTDIKFEAVATTWDYIKATEGGAAAFTAAFNHRFHSASCRYRRMFANTMPATRQLCALRTMTTLWSFSEEALEPIVRLHRPMHLQQRDFACFGQTLLDTFAEVLADKWSSEMRSQWQDVLLDLFRCWTSIDARLDATEAPRSPLHTFTPTHIEDGCPNFDPTPTYSPNGWGSR